MDIYSIIISLVALFATPSFSWDYQKQDEWPGSCKNAQGQSPVDIKTKETTPLPLAAIRTRFWNAYFDVKMINNGNGVTLDFTPFANKNPIAGPHILGGLEHVLTSEFYHLHQIHFHWGSEHTIDSVRFPLEIQCVTFSSEYTSYEMALENKNGVVIFSSLLEETPDYNSELFPITKALPKIQKALSETTIKVFPIFFIPNKLFQLKNFVYSINGTIYTYEGSLTTPYCNDTVQWIIMENGPNISRKQADLFKELLDLSGQRLQMNYRSTQPNLGHPVNKIVTV